MKEHPEAKHRRRPVSFPQAARTVLRSVGYTLRAACRVLILVAVLAAAFLLLSRDDVPIDHLDLTRA
jgi:hypothetical protein